MEKAISSCQVALYKCNGLKIRVPQIVAMDWFGQKNLGKNKHLNHLNAFLSEIFE